MGNFGLPRDYDDMNFNGNLKFKALVKRIAVVFIILRARRKQALFTLSTGNVIFKENNFSLLPNKTIKHSKPNISLDPLIYHQYPGNNKSCIVNCLKWYIRMQKGLVGEEFKNRIISFETPFKPVSHETISRWIKRWIKKLQMLKLAHLVSKLIVVVQNPPAKQRTLVFHYMK